MAYVIQLEPGGYFAIVATKLSIEQANEMAARLKRDRRPTGVLLVRGSMGRGGSLRQRDRRFLVVTASSQFTLKLRTA